MTDCIRLLIVEDSRESQLYLDAWLRKFDNLEVCHAETIQEALDILLSDFRPCVIVLDLDLAGESGESLFDSIRSLKDNQPRTVVVSGVTDEARLNRIYEDGPKPIQILRKPVDADVLLAAIGGDQPLTPKVK